MRSRKGASGLVLAAVLALCALAVPAGAATDVYPAGGGKFTGGEESWEVTEATCDVPVGCTASGGYEGGDGTPAGSLKADTNISLNLLQIFNSKVTLQSPDFKVSEAGAATLHLDRRFLSGSLVDLAPSLKYTVQLLDRTADKRADLLTETIASNSDWSGRDAAATVEAGHLYALAITAETSSSVVGTGLLSGSTSARFDNVALRVTHTAGGGSGGSGTKGGGGGNGGGAGAGGGLTSAQLAALAPSTLVSPAILKGNRLFVKARCPKKIGRACRISVIGLLKKRKPATATRTAKVAKGKKKQLVLKVKPRARGKVASRKRLLFKVRVRAGKTQATAFKRLKLIRR